MTCVARMRWGPWAMLAISLLPGMASAADRSLYAIGNSLTASMLPYSIPGLAAQRGQSFDVGFYTASGRALDYIVANPGLPNTGSPAALDMAFQAYTWSDISMQPYPSASSTLASDMASIRSIVAAASAGTSAQARLYLYSAWPAQTSFAAMGFGNWWRSAVPDELAQPTVLKRAHADHLLARLRAEFGTRAVHVIPVGDVLAAFDEQIRAGQAGSITSISQLYSDNDHVGDVGKFIAALTVYATVFRQSPEGMAIPAGYLQGSAAAQLTPQLAAQLQSLVWRVVNSDARTGVNSAPIASAQMLRTLDTVALPIMLAATDAEASPLSFTVLTAPAHGQLTGQPPTLTYLADAGYEGPDSFSFMASDGGLDSATATVSIAVTRRAQPDPEPEPEPQPEPQPQPGSAGGGALETWSLLCLAALLAARRKKDATQRR